MLLHPRFQIGRIWILNRDDVAVARVACASFEPRCVECDQRTHLVEE